MKINRVWAMPNKWTFEIKPIRHLIYRYGGDFKGWIDPFAGMNSPAEITNDLNPEMPTKYHLYAKDFVEQLNGQMFKGCLFDPPYSYRQVKEHYETQGIKPTQLDTSTNFYNRVKRPAGRKIELGGYVICFGWNSNGFGKKAGFKIIEMLIVAHGGHHNDTIVTVEQKIRRELF